MIWFTYSLKEMLKVNPSHLINVHHLRSILSDADRVMHSIPQLSAKLYIDLSDCQVCLLIA